MEQETDYDKVFQKLKSVDLYLKKPNLIIGRAKKLNDNMWVYDPELHTIVKKLICYSPGLYKIIDEILVNAADRVIEAVNQKCTKIMVQIDKKTGWISVENNGDSIPVRKSKKWGIYYPELLFTKTKTSSHYDDDKPRKSGGTHGLGAKATGIFSKEMQIDILDTSQSVAKRYVQTFYNNLKEIGDYEITEIKKKGGKKNKLTDYTKVSFLPDYERFGYDGMEDNIYYLIQKRCFDIAMTTKIKVYFNGEKCNSRDISSYTDYLLPENLTELKVVKTSRDKKIVQEIVQSKNENNEKKLEWIKCIEYSDDWTVCAIYDPNNYIVDKEGLSFVNSVYTKDGGSHLRHVQNSINKKLFEIIAKKAKNIDDSMKPQIISKYIAYFVSVFLTNPEYEGQTKDKLNTQKGEFSTAYKPNEKLIKFLATPDLVETIKNIEIEKKMRDITKETKKNKWGHFSIEKYRHASHKNRMECTLILTEGNSAAGSAGRALAELPPNRIGIYPLRGKLTNVKKLSLKQLLAKMKKKDSEIMAIMKIMGLDPREKYESFEKLNYRHILILSDQDIDGSHIKALVMVFFYHLWPGLFKIDDGRGSFLEIIKLDLVQISEKKRGGQELGFSDLSQFNNWYNNLKNKGAYNKPEYFKGLATYGKSFGKCFVNYNDKRIEIIDSPKNDQIVLTNYKSKCKNLSQDALELVFTNNKEDAERRRDWLEKYDSSVSLNLEKKKITINEFIHKALLPFSSWDNFRSIPFLVDSFKYVQRKIFWVSQTTPKKILTQFTGIVSDKSKYHHGETSLNKATICMAQCFAGTNNLPLLQDIGSYGSRELNGDDAGAPRYLYSKIQKYCKYLYPEDDNYVLTFQNEGKDILEPVHYVPIIAVIACNPQDGIGTGWSCKSHPCKVKDVIANTRNFIYDKPLFEMKPSYINFKGTIDKCEKNKYIVRGCYEIKDNEPDAIYIYDIPPQFSFSDFREFLKEILLENKTGKTQKKQSENPDNNQNEKNDKIKKKKSKWSNILNKISDFEERCSGDVLWFKIYFEPKFLDDINMDNLESAIWLKIKIHNLFHFWNTDKKPKMTIYNSYEDIIIEHGKVRLEYYQLQKADKIKRLNYQISRLKNIIRCLKYLNNNKLNYSDESTNEIRTDEEIEIILSKMNFDKLGNNYLSIESDLNYDYLLNLKMRDRSKNNIANLKKQLKNNEEELEISEKRSIQDMWLVDLENFEKEYNIWYRETRNQFEEDYKKIQNGDVTNMNSKNKKNKRNNSKKKNKEDSK